MRVLVVYCHPVETSFHAALHQEVLKNLRAAGHEVDDCDLYAEGFNPVLSREERLGYHDVPANRLPLAPYVERLQWAEGIVFCFPTWCFGLPAMLKGYFDRLFMPGVAFDISDPANVKPMLTHIKRISAVVTYGRPRWMAMYMGDPPRKIVTRYMKRLTGQGARWTTTPTTT
jgi:NAD(P)H dehydrogenase (quinone)